MTSPYPQPSPSAPDASPPQPPPPPALVNPEPESRLDQLTARLETAKEKAKRAKAEEDELTTAIKAELSRLHPGAKEILLHSAHLKTPWLLKQVTTVRFDSTGCRKTHPEVYSAFAKFSTVWRLGPLRN